MPIKIRIFSINIAAAILKFVFFFGAVWCPNLWAITPCVELDKSAVAWWTFDGTTKDEIRAYPIVLSPSTTFTAGKVNEGILFNAFGDSARAAHTNFLDLGANESFTMELWF